MTQNLKTFTRELEVELTEEELQLYGKLLAEKVNEEKAVDDKRKEIASKYTAQLKAIRNEQTRLATARSKGRELRLVECIERWHAGVIQIVRLDTDEVVDTRPATYNDQQTEFPWLDDEHSELPLEGDAPVESADAGGMVDSATGDQVYVMPDDDLPDDGDIVDAPAEPEPEPSHLRVVGADDGVEVDIVEGDEPVDGVEVEVVASFEVDNGKVEESAPKPKRGKSKGTKKRK